MGSFNKFIKPIATERIIVNRLGFGIDRIFSFPDDLHFTANTNAKVFQKTAEKI
jgi:hypothetical protein